MDDNRFDLLTKSLSTGLSRRRLLHALAATLGIVALGNERARAKPEDGSNEKCYGGGSKCTNPKQCCSEICTNRQCAPETPPDPCEGVTCDDENPCTTDSCSEGACSHVPLSPGTPCSTDGFCNSTGVCVFGVCAPGTSGTCYSGPDGTAGVGQCTSGTQVCDDTGSWGPCDGEVTPVPEVCGDGLDNDCSGVADDGCPTTTTTPPPQQCDPNFIIDPIGGNCVRDQTTCPANLVPAGDLRQCNLSGFNLSGFNLAGANLSSADLDANLSNANLTNANLTGAYLGGANLIGTNLIGANLTGADLNFAALIGANLFGANLTGAFLIGADLTGGANLTVANLTGAILDGANLHDADLNGATWSNTTCPDSTNSSNVGGTCCNNLAGAVANSC